MTEQSGHLIRSKLDRLLDSDFLRRSPSRLRLLRCLVERRLANDDGALREMSIGIEVFHRNPATYDPKSDPIVRVNVSRLRERLVKHYAMFEAPPQVRIDLPKGRYVPEFVELGARQLAAPRLLVLPFVQSDLLPDEYVLPAQRKGFAGVPHEASNAFVQSRRATALGTADGHQQARGLLGSAIAAAPDFAMAHAYLAATMGNLSMYERVTPKTAWRIGSVASKRALDIDPLEPSAYLNLAADKIYCKYDFPAARELLLTARKLAPRHPGVHMLMGAAASHCGELADALDHLDSAQEVDPLFPAIRADRGVAYYFAGQFDDANRVFIDLLTEYPQRTATRVTLAASLTMCGAFEAARNELNAVIEHDPNEAGARLALAVVNARDGDKRQAKKIVNAVHASSDIEKTNPSALAGAYAQLAELKEAMKWLTLAAESHEGGFAEVQVDPLLAPLLGADGFRVLLAKYGLVSRQIAVI